MRLTLKKDTLADLTADELGSVVGGITTLQLKSWADECPGTETAPTFPLRYCAVRTS